MRKSRSTEAQISGTIKEQETGMPTAKLCRRHGHWPALSGDPASVLVHDGFRCHSRCVGGR